MKGRRHWFLLLLDWLLIAFTVMGGVGLVFALIAQFITPVSASFFAFFALAYPLIAIFNIVVAAIWVVRWRSWAWLPLIVLAWGLFYAGRFVQVDFAKVYDHKDVKANNELTITTFNVHCFEGDAGRDVRRFLQYASGFNSDVICFQEFDIADSVEYKLADTLLYNWPYRAHTYNDGGNFTLGQAIFSKVPISKVNRVLFEGSLNSAIYVDLYWSVDTLRLFNCHLQTTAYNQVTGQRGVRQVISDSNSSALARSIAGRLRDNFKMRATQADTLADLRRVSPYGVIMVGDFNDSPMSYAYRTVRGELDDAFMSAGSGYGYTYNPMAKLFRIDYVLFDPRNLECVAYSSPVQTLSDHNPINVKLKSNNR